MGAQMKARTEIDKLMHGYQKQLGVPCGYCHDENAETTQINYASDENPVKQTARFMISMTGDINNKYLAQLGDRRYAQPITCGNCHRGRVEPPDFDSSPNGVDWPCCKIAGYAKPPERYFNARDPRPYTAGMWMMERIFE